MIGVIGIYDRYMMNHILDSIAVSILACLLYTLYNMFYSRSAPGVAFLMFFSSESLKTENRQYEYLQYDNPAMGVIS